MNPAQQKGWVCAPSLHQKTQGNNSVTPRRPQPPCARTARACLRDGARRVLFVGLGTLPVWEAAP